MSQILVNECRLCGLSTIDYNKVCARCLDLLDNGFYPKNISPCYEEVLDFSTGLVRYIPTLPNNVDWEYNPEYASFCKDYLLKEC